MENVLRRPFYREYAWAYDLLICGPVGSRCDFWEEAATRRGVFPGSWVLDAGCGTGSYAIELARRGYTVTGIDASPELVTVARRKARCTPLRVTFQVGDLLHLPPQPRYDGLLCRGVLNDIVDDAERRRAFLSFADALRSDGVLVLDVREWHATVRRKTKDPRFEKTVKTERGRLTFHSVTALDHARRRLLVAERHSLEKDDKSVVTAYDFVMRPWTQEELENHLTDAGFGSIAFSGDYDVRTPVGATDRIVAVASRKGPKDRSGGI